MADTSIEYFFLTLKIGGSYLSRNYFKKQAFHDMKHFNRLLNEQTGWIMRFKQQQQQECSDSYKGNFKKTKNKADNKNND